MTNGDDRFGTVTIGMTLLATLELGLRSLPDVVPLADLTGTVLALVSPLVSERAIVAWVVGWFFLATLAYKTYRRVDILAAASASPRYAECGTAALLATTVGITVKQQVFAQSFGHGSIPGPFAANAVFLLVGAAGLRYALARERFFGDAALAVLLGPAMAIAATLYPLPEVAVVVWIVGAVGVNTVPFGPRLEQVLNDPIERLMTSVTAAMTGASGLVTLLYVFAGLVFSLAAVIDSGGTTRTNLRTLVESIAFGRQSGAFAAATLQTDVFVLLVVFVPAAYGVWYWLRVVERLPESLGITALQSAGRGDDASAGQVERRAVPPGYGLPIGLLYALLIVQANVPGSEIEGEALPTGYLLAALGVTLLAAGTVAATRWRDTKPRDVSRLAPRAFTLQIAVITLAAQEPIPGFVHGVLTTGTPAAVGAGLVSAARATALMAGGAYVPSYIPALLRHNAALGLGLATIIVGGLVGLLSGGVELVRALGGLVMIVGIGGCAFGVFAELVDLVY